MSTKNTKQRKRIFSVNLLFWLIGLLPTQAQYIAEDLPQYPFVNYDANRFEFPGDSSSWNSLFARFDTLILEGKGQIRIVHIGGSHIQAGVLSGSFASRLQNFNPGLEGSRGFVFPYRITRSNNPRGYANSYEGPWEYCRSVNRKKQCLLGLSGLSVSTHSKSASFGIWPRQMEGGMANYSFTKVKLWYERDSSSFTPLINGVPMQHYNDTLGLAQYHMPSPTDSLELSFDTQAPGTHFTTYGLLLENDMPGITYYPIGLNGSTIPAFLRSELLEKHLAAIQPHWIILTLGTNDGYGRNFDPEVYRQRYAELLDKLKSVAPDAAILLTVPNDDFLYRRYPNPNTAKIADEIRKLCTQRGLALHNFYQIMGGYKSIIAWKRAGLARADLIHFTHEGYRLQADLLFEAFVKAYDNYLNAQNSAPAQAQKK